MASFGILRYCGVGNFICKISHLNDLPSYQCDGILMVPTHRVAMDTFLLC